MFPGFFYSSFESLLQILIFMAQKGLVLVFLGYLKSISRDGVFLPFFILTSIFIDFQHMTNRVSL